MKKAGIIIGITVLTAAAVGAVVYPMKKLLIPETDRTAMQTAAALETTTAEYEDPDSIDVSGYRIRIFSRGRKEEKLNAMQLGLHYDPARKKVTVDDSIFYKNAGKLSCFDDSTASLCANAKLGGYNEEAAAYDIIPEVDGNVIDDKRKAMDLIREAVLELRPEIDLDAGYGLYRYAKVRSDDSAINRIKNDLDVYVRSCIKYNDYGLVLDGSTIHRWLSVRDGKVCFDESGLEEWLDTVAEKYDTVDKNKIFPTSYGFDTVVKAGTYGWKVDRAKEKEMLKMLLNKGAVCRHDPEFSQTAVSHDYHDFGNTYVEVNLNTQHVFYYKDGELILDTPCVSGCTGLGRQTHVGAYYVRYKAYKVVLRGPGYASPVDYWMPFHNGEGLHDASWRGSFGGEIYKWNGSHGCVNLPRKAAKTIYENIEAGVPVFVYDAVPLPEKTEEEEKPEEEG